jgi:peptidoglycan/xylan/chitin deacetylase (PgdA/CDA1 family)
VSGRATAPTTNLTPTPRETRQGPLDGEHLHARRTARRRELARARRRRALLAACLLVAVVAALTAIALASRGSPAGSPSARASDANVAGRRGTGVGGAGGGSASTTKTPPRAAPILMYHVINPPPPGAPYPGLYVAPQEFAEQMRALAQAGYRAVTLDQLWANWHEGAPLPAGKPVVLSFDNGYQSQYTNALPVLRGLGWVGVENIQLTGLPPSQGGLSSAQVAGLVAAGWELDTQGISHADLTTLDAAELHQQVASARGTIQRRYRVPVNWFCYPSGQYDATVVAAVQAAGYRGSTTVVPGWAGPDSDADRLPRLRVLGGTSGAALVSELPAIRHEPPPPASYVTN